MYSLSRASRCSQVFFAASARIQVNIEIMRAFIRLRQMLASNAQLARRLDALEKKYDVQFKQVFEAIRQLMAPPEPKRRPIGFPNRGQ